MLRQKRIQRRKILIRILIYILLSVGALLVSIPFLWMISTALKPIGEIFAFPPRFIPSHPLWSNFLIALTEYPFGLYLKNTLIVTTISTLGTIISCSTVAFSFARLRWPGRDLLFIAALATMMLPEQVTMIPTFILFRYLGWVNTFLPLIIPAWFARQPFYVFLLRQFFMTIPVELDDAARIDGAGFLDIYLRIIIPMSKPALGIVAILFFQFKWDEFMAPLIYLHDSELFTLALGLRAFSSEYGTQWNLMMAASCVFMLPLMITYYLAQKYYVQGIVFTGLKG
jgi:ABC-type glycerol-3-phosphate transport system permease component